MEVNGSMGCVSVSQRNHDKAQVGQKVSALYRMGRFSDSLYITGVDFDW